MFLRFSEKLSDMSRMSVNVFNMALGSSDLKYENKNTIRTQKWHMFGQCSTSTFEDSCGCTVEGMPYSVEMTEQINKTGGEKAAITSSLPLERPEVLRHYLGTIGYMKEREAEGESTRRCSLNVRDRAIASQISTGTVSKATLAETSNRRGGVHKYHLELN